MKKQLNEIKRMQYLAGIITESQLNEDDTHLNKIARDLYSFLKKNGVNVVLSKTTPGSPAKTIGDMSKQGGMSRLDVTRDNTAQIFVYKGRNNQTEISIQLFGGQKPVEEVEKKLLAAYPGLEQFDRKGGYLGLTQQSNIYGLSFRVKEKTTKKGGYVSNTPTNPKPSTQVAQAAESLDIDSIVNEVLKALDLKKKEESLMNEASSDEVPLSDRVKKFIDKAVASAKKDGEFENLIDAEWFDNELIDELIDLFPNKDYDRASKEVMDYISQVTK